MTSLNAGNALLMKLVEPGPSLTITFVQRFDGNHSATATAAWPWLRNTAYGQSLTTACVVSCCPQYIQLGLQKDLETQNLERMLNLLLQHALQ